MCTLAASEAIGSNRACPQGGVPSSLLQSATCRELLPVWTTVINSQFSLRSQKPFPDTCVISSPPPVQKESLTSLLSPLLYLHNVNMYSHKKVNRYGTEDNSEHRPKSGPGSCQRPLRVTGFTQRAFFPSPTSCLFYLCNDFLDSVRLPGILHYFSKERNHTPSLKENTLLANIRAWDLNSWRSR